MAAAARRGTRSSAMILTPSPLQPPALASAQAHGPGEPGLARSVATPPGVLRSARAPRQLCLDLQPRERGTAARSGVAAQASNQITFLRCPTQRS
jgi:hypothetical protein